MRAIDVFSMCIRNLYKRKLRTLLTLLGVMIGTGSIIVMISLGLATDAQFAQMIDEMDLDMTVIRVWPQWGGMMWTPDGGMEEMQQRDLTDDSADQIMRIPGVRVATPMMQGWMHFRSGPYVMNTSVTGVRPEALALMGHTLESGRFLSGDGEFEAVFSGRTELEFFDATDRTVTHSERRWETGDDVETLVDVQNDAISIFYDTSQFWNTRDFGWGSAVQEDVGIEIEEDFVPVRSFEIDVVGVIRPTEIEMRWGGGHQIFMDIDTLRMLNRMRDDTNRRAREEDDAMPRFSAILDGGERQTYDELWVRVASPDDIGRVADTIRELGYQAQYDAEWIENQRDMTRNVETLLAAIAFVSLVVAAINIANTMITSVTERTREIGVMKVIGASISDVRKLFLLESVVIGLLGGLFGTALALIVSYVMNNFEIAFLQNLFVGAPMGAEDAAISLITPWLCVVALAVAGGVGMVSGFYPAWRATRLSALAAIRGD